MHVSPRRPEVGYLTHMLIHILHRTPGSQTFRRTRSLENHICLTL
jgi:hypothetical protein